MDKTIQVLGWFVMGTLALAIARQLSEQKVFDFMPSNYGAAIGRRGWNRRLLAHEGFASTKIVGWEKDQPSVHAPEKVSAQNSYEKDVTAQNAMVGNYVQRTNNFPHTGADNC